MKNYTNSKFYLPFLLLALLLHTSCTNTPSKLANGEFDSETDISSLELNGSSCPSSSDTDNSGASVGLLLQSIKKCNIKGVKQALPNLPQDELTSFSEKLHESVAALWFSGKRTQKKKAIIKLLTKQYDVKCLFDYVIERYFISENAIKNLDTNKKSLYKTKKEALSLMDLLIDIDKKGDIKLEEHLFKFVGLGRRRDLNFCRVKRKSPYNHITLLHILVQHYHSKIDFMHTDGISYLHAGIVCHSSVEKRGKRLFQANNNNDSEKLEEWIAMQYDINEMYLDARKKKKDTGISRRSKFSVRKKSKRS